MSGAEVTALKTVTYENYHSFKSYGDRLGFVQHNKYVFRNDDGEYKRQSEDIVSFYFGFYTWQDARKFEQYAKFNFQKLNAYHSHCVVRESSRLATPYEVKIRNVETDLLRLFISAVNKELESGQLSFDYDAITAIPSLSKERVQKMLKRCN